MALFFSPFFKKLKGHIGNLVFYHAMGQNRIRTQAPTASVPQTGTHRLQRCRMRAVVSFYSANRHTLLRAIWKVAAKDMNMSGYNLFIQRNMSVFNDQHQISDYRLLRLSTGSLVLPPQFIARRTAADRIVVGWENDVPDDALRSLDRLILIWLKASGSFGINVITDAGACRKNEMATVVVPEIADKDIHLYCLFIDCKQSRFSPDRYFYLPQSIF